ncbi:hypothetical protein OROHE_018523 [Orobanche hederae]
MNLLLRIHVMEHAKIRREAIRVRVRRDFKVMGRKMVLDAITEVVLMALPCSTLVPLLEDMQSGREKLSIFTAKDLDKATNYFYENNILHRYSDFGITYRGMLPVRRTR